MTSLCQAGGLGLAAPGSHAAAAASKDLTKAAPESPPLQSILWSRQQSMQGCVRAEGICRKGLPLDSVQLQPPEQSCRQPALPLPPGWHIRFSRAPN